MKDSAKKLVNYFFFLIVKVLSLFQKRHTSIVVVSGSPRSGTTWLAESLFKALKCDSLIWEPLQDGNPAVWSTAFGKRPFIPDSKFLKSDAQFKFFHELIRGEQVNWHLLRLKKYPKNIRFLFPAKSVVIKFVRGNGVVGYLRRQFGVLKPLVVMRHPCAVVASQMSMGNMDDHPYIDTNLLSLLPWIADHIDYNAPLPERLATTWACDVLAAKFSLSDVHIVYYEDIVMHGSKVLSPILDDWGFDVSGEVIDAALSSSSSTTFEWSNHRDQKSKLSIWKQRMDESVVESVISKVRSMGVYDYSSDALPLSPGELDKKQ